MARLLNTIFFLYLFFSIPSCSSFGEREEVNEYQYKMCFIHNLILYAPDLYSYNTGIASPIIVEENGDLIIGTQKLSLLSVKSQWQGIYATESTDFFEKYIGISLLHGALWVHQLDPYLFNRKKNTVAISPPTNSSDDTSETQASDDPEKLFEASGAEKSYQKQFFQFILWDHPHRRIAFDLTQEQLSTNDNDIREFINIHIKNRYTVRSIHVNHLPYQCMGYINEVLFNPDHRQVLCIVRPNHLQGSDIHRFQFTIFGILNQKEALAVYNGFYYRIGFYFHNVYISKKTAHIPKNCNTIKTLSVIDFIHHCQEIPAH